MRFSRKSITWSALPAYEARVLWPLGYPEQALQKSKAALALARGLSYPPTLAVALYGAAMLHQVRRERPLAQERAEATIVLGREQSIHHWEAYGSIVHGWALAMQGQWEEGIARIQQGLVAQQMVGAQI